MTWTEPTTDRAVRDRTALLNRLRNAAEQLQDAVAIIDRLGDRAFSRSVSHTLGRVERHRRDAAQP